MPQNVNAKGEQSKTAVSTIASPSDQRPIQITLTQPAAKSVVLWEQPAFSGALVAFIGTIIVIFSNARFHKQRLAFEERLATKKSEFDIALAERKRVLDQDLADWERKSEFAELALAEFYEARSRIQEIRSPMSFSSDNDDRTGRDEESADLRAARDRYYPVARRIRMATDFFNTFYSKRYRAAALFGVDAELPYRGIWSALTLTNGAAGALMSPAAHQGGANSQDFIRSMEERVWEGLAEVDVIMNEVTAAVSLAEQLFQPVITGLPRGH